MLNLIIYLESCNQKCESCSLWLQKLIFQEGRPDWGKSAVACHVGQLQAEAFASLSSCGLNQESQTLQSMPLVPVFRSQSGQHSEFQNSQSYIERLHLKRRNKEKMKKKSNFLQGIFIQIFLRYLDVTIECSGLRADFPWDKKDLLLSQTPKSQGLQDKRGLKIPSSGSDLTSITV